MRSILFALGVVIALGLVAQPAQGGAGLVGRWRDSVTEGAQETLTLFSNGAYKSETVLVDPEALRVKIAADCRARAKRSRKVHCDDAFVEKDFETLSKLYPSVMIGTYEVASAKIEFTHACAEGVEDCKVDRVTDSGIFFIDGDTLTIKLSGMRYKGHVIGGGSSTYTRQP